MAWYRPLSRNVVLSWRVKGGLIVSPDVEVASETGAFIPPEQRFYAGGPNDVRGFDRNELGPGGLRDTPERGDRSGLHRSPIRSGSRLLVATASRLANVELRVPSPILSSRLRLAAFVDAGGVWQRGGNARTAVIRVTPGVGLRVATPLGPARLDVAYNPYKLQPGTLFQFDAAGNLTPVAGTGLLHPAPQRKFTFHIAVGQPF